MKPLRITEQEIPRFIEKTPSLKVVDCLDDQLKELFLTRNPQLKFQAEKAKTESENFLKQNAQRGEWIYFPWNNTLVHVLPEEEFYELRSSRNHNLITKEEQQIFRNFHIGILGLSVGNSAAMALILEGAEHLRLADFDELSLSNLNRIRASVVNLGENKVFITAHQIYELNPFAKLQLREKGIGSEADLEMFATDPSQLDIIVDEMDDVVMKIKLRLLARKLRIPIVSAADNGDNTIMDVERYDLEPEREIFHGALGEIKMEELKKMNFGDRIKLINKMVGIEYVTSRMKQSLLEVGNTLYSWPQLGGAAMLSGSALVYVIRKIAVGEKVQSGKFDINLEKALNEEYNSQGAQEQRRRETTEFLERQEQSFPR